ncbi:MAG: hypothetical protein WKF84_16270 [Pyrinomonadaceae bacterium]
MTECPTGEYLGSARSRYTFLVSSGDCFVVMGMARDRVERSVGLSFEKVAAEMIDDESSEDNGQAAALTDEAREASAADKARRKRALSMLVNTLIKLINIEVQVPTPNQNQFSELLTPGNLSRLIWLVNARSSAANCALARESAAGCATGRSTAADCLHRLSDRQQVFQIRFGQTRS